MNNQLIETEVAQLLLDRKLTLSIAESCTGGLLGHRLTDVPGSSGFFRGGVVAYSYEAKRTLLNVDYDTLVACGAVSADIAVQMALGARDLFHSDYALSITGIAGPGGGMPGKPVGLVYIGLAAKEGAIWRKYVWNGDRSANKQQSVDAALALLKDVILKRIPVNEFSTISK